MSDPQMPPDDATDTRRMKAAFLTVAAVLFATVPFVVPFDGFEPTNFPVPQDDPPVQPAGYAFSIWGPIYLWLLVHALYGLVKRSDMALWDAPRWPLTGSLVIGAAWLPVAQTAPLPATAMIWAMLALALLALLRTPAEAERWLLRAPVALYAGWLTAASWVALALAGAGYGVGQAAGLGETGWAWIGLSGALVTALAVTRLVQAVPLYTLGVVWALVGVAVANWGADWGLVVAALGGAAVVAAPEGGGLRLSR